MLPLALILTALCYPLVFGFRYPAKSSKWGLCRVLGILPYGPKIPAEPPHERDLTTAHYAYKAGVTREYKSRKQKVYSHELVKSLFRFKRF